MKKLARLAALKYTAYGLFCLFFSVTVIAATGFFYAVSHGLYELSYDIVALSDFDAFAYSMRYGFGIITVSCGILSALLLTFVMIGAGCKRGSDEVHLRKTDKAPFEMTALFFGGLIYLLIRICLEVIKQFAFWNLFVICPAMLLASLLFEEIFITAAIRYKADTLLTNTLLWRFGLILKNVLRSFALTKRIALMMVIYTVATCVVFYYRTTLTVVVWTVITLVCYSKIYDCVKSIDVLNDCSKKMASGDLNSKCNVKEINTVFNDFAENLNHIGDGLAKAVHEKTKSERFRTELITNVSHDIKTPLTSIINYVDLLKHSDTTEDEKKQYLDVLDRQSAKLKKLIVDLVEASKAITGSISVNLAPTNLTELLNQAAAEYTDRFQASDLTAVITSHTEKATVMGDGRLLWRIFDNLMSNICKYSLADTRVYIDIYKSEKGIDVVFKNISSFVLNISPDELIERFVRGDASRSTEGSGLGLSIASSLAELQKGRLELTVDGDLFKAALHLPSYDEGAETKA